MSSPAPFTHFMASNNYDFRQFQAELAALDRSNAPAPAAPSATAAPATAPARPLGKKAAAILRLERAREEFLALRARHQLTVADVVAFFPEEEGIAYLQSLLATPVKKTRARTPSA